MRLSKRVRDLKPSATLALDAKAKALAAAGRSIVNMTVGEPDFEAPAAVRAAAVAKVESGDVRYTAAAGTAGLREAIAAHLTETRQIPFTSDQVTVCHSAKHALSATLAALVGEGDDVVVPLPAWSSYFAEVEVTGARLSLVPPAQGCRPDFEAIERALTADTRVVMINSPSNPTGYVWTDNEIDRIAALAAERDFTILSDEIYSRMVYEGPRMKSPAECGAAGRAHTVIVDGASKAFAMTGYRIGFVAGPEELAAAVGRLNSQTTGSPNAVSQAAYEAALRREPAEVEEMVRAFGARRRVLLEGLRGLELEVPEPRGAFYAFPNVANYLDERGSEGFCSDILEEEGLAIVPGSVFGMDDHVRLSYVNDQVRIREALTRLGRFLESRTTGR